MNALIASLSGPACRQLLWTLAHGLWQGALLALLLAAVLSRLAGNRPQARYLLSIVALLALVISSLVTWSVLDLPAASNGAAKPTAVAHATENAPGTASSTLAPAGSQSDASPAMHGADYQSTATAICSAAWLAGVLVMLGRLAWLVTGARRLAARPLLADRRVLELVERIRGRLGIARSIRVIDAADFGPSPSPWPKSPPYRYDTDEPLTDSAGRFRFSTLPAGEFHISNTALAPITWKSSDGERIVHTGETIELRASKPGAQ